MINGFVHLHSTLRYLVLVIIFVVLLKSFIGWITKRTFEQIDNKMSLYMMIFTHIQLVLGLVLLFIGGRVSFASGFMKVPELRFWAIEHPLAMLLAITAFTLARVRSKRAESDEAKFKQLFIFTLIGVVLVCSAIPSFRGFSEFVSLF